MKVNIYRKGCKSESMDNTSNDRAINAAIIQEMQNQLNKLIKTWMFKPYIPTY